MGGEQWAADNLQVLCARCNRIKTARDMGAIARWKRYEGRGMGRKEEGRWIMGEEAQEDVNSELSREQKIPDILRKTGLFVLCDRATPQIP
jgi:hypothetical protein